jgi:hypothetical protein
MPTKHPSTAKAEAKLAAELAEKPTISPDEAALAMRRLHAFQFNRITRKESLAASMTVVNGAKQAGRKAKAGDATIVKRDIRSFRDDRERQLLKQASTQLYFALEKWLRDSGKKEKVVEAQMMHLQYGDKHFVFVAVNETKVSQYIKNIIGSSPSDIKNMLTAVYEPRLNVEGKRRSKSYAKKLRTRIFGDTITIPESTNVEDANQARQVATQLRNPWKMLNINTSPQANIEALINNESGGVYVLDNHQHPDTLRHAEEFLVDVGEIVKMLGSKNNTRVYTCVGGKKRPCMSCYGRMFSVINRFNPRPGLVWLHAAGRQSPTVFQRTSYALLTQSSHVSRDGRGRDAQDFDSASDSDAAQPSLR